MGSKWKTRDYSARTIEQFENQMDRYFDEETNKIKAEWFLIVKFHQIFYRNANGNADSYIRALSDRRDREETMIVETWGKVAGVERSYKRRYSERQDLCNAYSRILNAITDRIDICAFQQPTKWAALLTDYADDYTKFLESKAREIIKKDVEDMEDSEIEILAYVALTTTDTELKEKIYNAFYKDTTSAHIHYPNDKPEDPYYRYYDRDDTQWKKFAIYAEFYYEQQYEDYCAGNVTEEQINDVIQNKLLLDYMDRNGKSFLTEGPEVPVHFSKDGTVTMTAPPGEHLTAWYRKTPGNSGAFKDSERLNGKGKKMEYNSNPRIANGEDAAKIINDELADGLYIERRIDYKKIIKKVVLKGISLIPGGGEVSDAFGKIYGAGEKAYDAIKEIDETSRENTKGYFYDDWKPSYQWFISKFDLKCVMTDNGYVLFQTPDTRERVNNFLAWLKEKRPDIYEDYAMPQACFDREMTEAEWFVSNTDVVALYNNLGGAGLLNDLPF